MHPEGDVDRTYLKRKKGGRGLVSVEECAMLEKVSLGSYIDGKEEALLQEVAKEDVMSENENPKTTQSTRREILQQATPLSIFKGNRRSKGRGERLAMD